MSKAFYPTNDGHVGNLQKLPDRELLDLLKRQEDLLHKKQSLLNKFPDKGERVKKHLETLKQELNRRHAARDISNKTDKMEQVHKDNDNGDITESMSVKSSDNKERKNDLIESDFEKLSIKEDKLGLEASNTGHKEQKHQFEIAVERAAENAQSGLRQPIKLNRKLKTKYVKDLPPEIQKLKSPNVNPAKNLQQDCIEVTKVPEESAVVPPSYRYSEAKEIQLIESLQLQQQQKLVQEELNAKLAAEKLAEPDRFTIRMEKYNPEGVDMSYRNTRQGQYDDDLDSDDDLEGENKEYAGYSHTLIPSDTED